MPQNKKYENTEVSSFLEDDAFIMIDSVPFGVVQTAPPKDLLLKTQELNFIQDDLKHSVAREEILREKNIRLLDSYNLKEMTSEEMDTILKESYTIEEQIKSEKEFQKKIFDKVFDVSYELIKWALGEKIFDSVKEKIEAMSVSEVANKAYEAVSKNKVLSAYIASQNKK